MNNRSNRWTHWLLSACLLSAGISQARTVAVDQVLSVRFHLEPFPTDLGAVTEVNALLLQLFGGEFEHGAVARATLFDGSKLLGQHTSEESSFRFFSTWASPASLYGSSNPTLIDFTTLADRSINGRIEVSFDRTVDFSYVGVQAGIGINNLLRENVAVVDSIQVSNLPEPSSYMLLGTGTLLLLAMRRR